MIYFAHGDEVHSTATSSNSTPLIIAGIFGALVVIAVVAYVLRKSRAAKLPANKSEVQTDDISK